MASYYTVKSSNPWFTDLTARYQVKTPDGAGNYVVAVEHDVTPVIDSGLKTTSITKTDAATKTGSIIGTDSDIKLVVNAEPDIQIDKVR